MAPESLITTSAADLRAALPQGGALLGLDLGTQTIGTAFCDPGWRFASPGKTLKRGKFGADRAGAGSAVAERTVQGIVIGLPLNMDGSEGPRCQSSRAYARNRRRRAGLAGAAVGRTLVHRQRRTRPDRSGHEPGQARDPDRFGRRCGDPARRHSMRLSGGFG
jgi:hypothetical protein